MKASFCLFIYLLLIIINQEVEKIEYRVFIGKNYSLAQDEGYAWKLYTAQQFFLVIMPSFGNF